MKKSVIISVIVILLIVGCKSQGTGGSKIPFLGGKSPGTKETTVDSDVYKGTDGLVLELLKDSPPDKIYDTQNLHLVAELKNNGTYELYGDLYLSGVDPSIVRGLNLKKAFGPIEPRTRFFTDGGYDTISYESSSISIPKGTDTYSPTITLTACFNYRTEANPIVCVDPNLENIIVDSKACRVQPVSVSGGQGAPVAVTNIVPETTGKQMYFKIVVENVGRGQIAKSSGCPYNLEYEDMNLVTIKTTLSGITPVKCSPRNPVRLTDGRATVTCIFDIPARNSYAYTTPLQVKLDYGYMLSISKKVDMVHIR